MAQQQVIMNLDGGKQMVTGTARMHAFAPDRLTHARQLSIGVPRFKSRPDITISLYSDDDEETLDTEFSEEDRLFGNNPGTTFAAWAVEWNPREELDDRDQIAVAATRTDGTDLPTDVRVFCSYVAFGDPAEVDEEA